jgi:hypothetical protein
MEPLWTAAEEELLLSLIYSSSCGGLCRAARTWTEISDLMNIEAARQGINMRAYNSSNAAYHYAQMPKEQLKQGVKDVAARMAKADGADKKSTKAPVPHQGGFASRKLPTPPSSPKVMELATRATGPPKDFEKYKG